MDKKDSFTITILALVLFIEISIHLKTLKIICPRRVFCGNPRGSGVRPRSRGLEEKASGEDHMSRDRALACLASGPPEVEPSTQPSHCEGEESGNCTKCSSNISVFSAATADTILCLLYLGLV